MKTKKENSVLLLLKWAEKDRGYLIASVICAFLGGLLAIGPYIGIYRLMDAFLTDTCSIRVISENAVLITATVIIRQVFQGLSGIFSHKGAYGALFRVRCMITEHLSKVPLGALDERRTGDIKTVLNEDIEKLELCLAHNIPELVGFATGPVVIFIYLMTINVPLAMISLIPLGITLIIMVGCFAFMAGMMPRVTEAMANFNSVIIEYINGMKLIKAYNMSRHSFQKFSGAIEEENRIWNKVSRKTGPFYAAFIVVLECGMALIIPIGGRLFLNGSITASIFLLFAYIGSLYLSELLPLQQLSMELAQSLNGVRKAKQILDLPIFDSVGDFPKSHDVTLKAVRFSYDGKTDVLTDCDLHVAEGEKVAIVGASGAGKTTVIELISRFYDVTDGKITIDGKDVRDVSQHELREKLGYVPQKAVLFSGDIASNILYGNPDGSEAEMIEAATIAQATEFIDQKKKKYKSPISQGGANVSGGQKQRLSIARAIAKHPDVYIFDDSFSALDYKTDATLRAELKEKTAESTVMIVAQRISTILHADQIIVLEDGQIVGKGTHKELLKNCEAYYQIASSQLSEKELEEDLKEVE